MKPKWNGGVIYMSNSMNMPKETQQFNCYLHTDNKPVFTPGPALAIGRVGD